MADEMVRGERLSHVTAIRNVMGSSSSGVCSVMGDYAEYFLSDEKECCSPSPISSKDNMH